MKRWKRKGWALRALRKFPDTYRIDAIRGRYFIREMTPREKKATESSRAFNRAILAIYEPEIKVMLNDMRLFQRIKRVAA